MPWMPSTHLEGPDDDGAGGWALWQARQSTRTVTTTIVSTTVVTEDYRGGEAYMQEGYTQLTDEEK